MAATPLALPDPDCGVATFTEQVPDLVAARGSITVRAVSWAIGQLRGEHATLAGLARQLGTSWKTLWRAIKPRLQGLAADQTRFGGRAQPGRR
ncbi:transposase family protein [Acidipropionibacterium thoenii]|uniref:transposase family protein n=1 Tax=Acidipropionibacterium thoenii TaxID=1751 RepID=UPI0003F8C9C9|nr:transposase family protein [Acidipropionibacterium thoenii]